MKCPNKLTIITRKIRISRRFYLLNNRFYKMFLLIEQSRCDRCSNILFIFIFTPLRHASPLSSPYCGLSRRQSKRRLDLSNFRHARNTRQWKKRIGKLCSRGWPDVVFDQDETGGVQRSAAWVRGNGRWKRQREPTRSRYLDGYTSNAHGHARQMHSRDNRRAHRANLSKAGCLCFTLVAKTRL